MWFSVEQGRKGRGKSEGEQCRLLGSASLGFLLLVCSSMAFAQVDGSCSPDSGTSLEQLLDDEHACLTNSGFLYTLGQQLNFAGRYAEALDRLEAAIMLNPDLWRAQLEYAIALQGTGDEASALALLKQLESSEAVQPEVRQELAVLRARPVPQRLPSTPARKTLLGVSAGYDDNLIGVTRYDSLQLTLPSGSLPVTLDSAGRPQGGSFARLEYMHERLLVQTDSGNWRGTVLGSYRWTPTLHEAAMGHIGLALLRAPEGGAGWYGNLLYQQVNRGGAQSLWQMQAGLGLEQASMIPGLEGKCRGRLGGEYYLTRYPQNHLFDGTYTGLLLQTACLSSGFLMQVRLGQDRPDADGRPGGEQNQLSVRLGKSFALGPGWVSGEYEYSQQNDRTGYSTLLENNARREVRWHVLRTEYRWQSWGVTPYVGVDYLDQRSNIALFSPRNLIVSVGLRHLW